MANSFPVVGDTCPSCKDISPRKLRELGSLEKNKAAVAACEYCDGERIFEIFEANRLNGEAS